MIRKNIPVLIVTGATHMQNMGEEKMKNFLGSWMQGLGNRTWQIVLSMSQVRDKIDTVSPVGAWAGDYCFLCIYLNSLDFFKLGLKRKTT